MNTNILDGKVMETFKDKLHESLSSAFVIAKDQAKEVELTIKINVGISTLITKDQDEDNRRSYNSPNMDYQITRKVKESKFDSKGEIRDAELMFDKDGKPYLVSTDNQMRMDDYDYETDSNPPREYYQTVRGENDEVIDIEPTEILQIEYEGEIETEIPEDQEKNNIIPFRSSKSTDDDFFEDEGAMVGVGAENEE